VEWLERFIEAREKSVTKENILWGWRGAGLFPKNMHRILIQLAGREESAPPNTPMPTSITPAPLFANGSPPDHGSPCAINQAFLAEIFKINIGTPFKTRICRLSGLAEQCQASLTLTQEELLKVKETNGHCKE
jgi:hypothetical protein